MRITFFFIIGATVFALGESVNCYECIESVLNITAERYKCKEPFSSSHNNLCMHSSYYCVKGFTLVQNKSTILRGCMNPNVSNLDADNLPDFPNPVKFEVEFYDGPHNVTAYFCKTDLCNSASLPTTIISFLILFLLILFLV